jgi:hypothetical protein
MTSYAWSLTTVIFLAKVSGAPFQLRPLALLSVASEDSRNALVLKRAALQRFALDYWRV